MASVLLSKQQTISTTQSLNIVRNAVRTALSSIAYLRNLFEEDAFEDKEIGDLSLKILRPHNAESKLILSWLEQGVFDALEKKYLRLLAFGIHNQDDELLECYHFKFNYGEDGIDVVRSSQGSQQVRQKIATKDEARDQTLALLKSLIVLTQSLTPLPAVHHLSLKLWYYDDRVPAEYEPEFFRPADAAHQLKFGDIPQDCTIGDLTTGIHDLSVRIKTVAEADDFQEEDVSDRVGLAEALNGEIIPTQLASRPPGRSASQASANSESADPSTQASEIEQLETAASGVLRHLRGREEVRRADIAAWVGPKRVSVTLKELQASGAIGQFSRKRQSYPVLLNPSGKRCSVSSCEPPARVPRVA